MEGARRTVTGAMALMTVETTVTKRTVVCAQIISPPLNDIASYSSETHYTSDLQYCFKHTLLW